MEAISYFFHTQVERLLMMTSLSHTTIDKLERWVILLIIILFALAVDAVIRIGVARVLQQIVSRTKATWDDHIFNKNVIKRLCNFVTPTIIYILLPIAFSSTDGSNDGMHLILERGV